jgi:hypothetical protein
MAAAWPVGLPDDTPCFCPRAVVQLQMDTGQVSEKAPDGVEVPERGRLQCHVTITDGPKYLRRTLPPLEGRARLQEQLGVSFHKSLDIGVTEGLIVEAPAL